MDPIHNIIFDLGHVILNIDPMPMVEAFSKLGAPHAEAAFKEACTNGLIDAHAKGELSAVEFESRFQKLLHLQVTSSDFEAAFNKMLLDIPAERLELLALLKKKYRLFLLSNTNPIHLPHIQRYLKTLIGAGFERHFEGEYYSHLIKLLKPDPAAYEYVLAANSLVAAETVFVDDAVENIESAKTVGLEVIHISGPLTFEKAARTLLIG
jgi:glucose-1-phosphatase